MPPVTLREVFGRIDANRPRLTLPEMIELYYSQSTSHEGEGVTSALCWV